MNYAIDKIYNGFRLKSMDFIYEIKSTALIFEHIKSGARLMKLENNDDNNVFSITFRTPPCDNSGLPHILEHSVLCGSKKFNTKEPFVELAKGSLNTFLNAFTFPDKTMYPVSSKNEKDFFNLMNVYLDAVFYPNIYNNAFILMQEGWHYELDSKKDEIKYKGVVYNEMKGSFSSDNRILYNKIQSSLFPDTIYFFESGGIPEEIPLLTQNKFIEFHKKYYHPENSYIYLYGNGDILKELEFIDKEYLNNFDKININSKINAQDYFNKPLKLETDYPISENEDTKNKYIFSLNYRFGDSTDTELSLALSILEYILLETPASPLKKALLDVKIANDIFGISETEILHMFLSVVAKHSEIKNRDKFIETVNKTLKKIVNEGIEKDLIEGSINHHEFILREADFDEPKGLYYGVLIMTSWLYDKDPVVKLKFENTLNSIKEKSKERYFEELIEKYLINNNHMSIITLNPNKGLIKEKENEIKIKLQNYKNKLDDKQIEELINNTKELKKRQSMPDSIDSLNKIPILLLNDIKKESEVIPLLEKKINNSSILYCPFFTNKIIYLNLLFNTKGVQQEDLPYISLLAEILTEISTKKYTYYELAKLIDINIGELEFEHEIFISKENDSNYMPMFIINARVLTEKLPILIELLNEIINNSIFDEKNRFKEIILEVISNFETLIMSKGNIYSRKRLKSYFSHSGSYSENTTGISFYEFLKKIKKDLNKNFSHISQKLSEISKIIFNKNNLTINITADDEGYKIFEKNYNLLTNNLSIDKIKMNDYNFNLNKLNEGIVSSSQVQYVSKGYNLKKCGFKYSGTHKVLQTIVSLDYLWNKVRVQGGAYGSSMGIGCNGIFFLTSFRNPNIIETLKVYDELPLYLKNFQSHEREMRKYIIGTIGDLEPDLNPRQKGELALKNYLQGITNEDLQKERDEILSIKISDIRDQAEIIEKGLKENYICVFGNENKINHEKDLFNKIKKIFD